MVNSKSMPAVLRLAVSRPKTVLVVAALVAVLASVFSAGVVGKLKTGGFDDPDSAHVRGTTVLNERFRTASPNLVVTVEKPGGNVDDPDAVEAGKAVTDRLRETADVTLVGSYWAGGGTDLRSRQGDAGLVLARVAGDEDASADRTAALHDALARTGGPVRVRFGGLTQLNNDLNDQVTADLAKAESIAIPITLILLLIVFGTVIAAGVPLVVGLISILGTLGALSGIAALTDVSVFAVNLTTALGLGLAVDYSLLFVSRYREERARLGAGPAAPPDGDVAIPVKVRAGTVYRSAHQARQTNQTVRRAGPRPVGSAPIPAAPAALAAPPLEPRALTVAALTATMRTAGRTIVFSAATVAIALCCLLVFSQYFLRSFAFAGAAVVGLTVLGALVVLPAMLMLLGHRIDRWALPGRRHLARSDAGVWGRVAAVVLRRPLLTAAPVVVVLLALGAPFLHVNFGVPDDRVLPKAVESRQVADRLRNDFAVTPVGSLAVVASNWGSGQPADARTAAYAETLSRVDGVDRVDSGAGSFAKGQRVAPAGADAVTRFQSGEATWLSVLSRVEPYSKAGGDLARAVRKASVPDGRTVLVAGQAAQLVDITGSIADRLPIALILIGLTTFVLLFLLTGSVLLPLKALALNVLTLVGVFGMMVAIFQDGHLSGLLGFTATPIAVAIPVLLFCVTFGLSMDYEVFVLARISERHEAGADLATAVTEGLSRSGRIISAAASILSASFLAMLVSGVSTIKLLGLGAGLAILIDALLVRPVLVPAFMRLAGDWNWWAPAPLRAVHARFGLSEGGTAEPAASLTTMPLHAEPPVPARPVDPARPAVPEPEPTAVARNGARPIGPRRLDQREFEAIRILADRAPSAHNTQPWIATPAAAQEIGWDPEWRLGASDPSGRDHRLSLGAYIETCLVLAANEGVATEFVPAYDEEQCRVGYLVGAATVYRTPFTQADVHARRTWRGAWQSDPLDLAMVAWLHETARKAGARLVQVSCADVRELLVEASRYFFGNPEIAAELREWARLSPRHPNYAEDGLRDSALGLDFAEAAGLRAAIHPSVRPIAHRIGLPAMLAAVQGQAFDGTGSILVLLGPAEAGPAAEVDLGRTMLRLWLGLARRGLAAHPQSQLLDCPQTVEQLAQLVGADDERVVWVARVGRPEPAAARTVAMSARRSRVYGAAPTAVTVNGSPAPLGDLLTRCFPT